MDTKLAPTDLTRPIYTQTQVRVDFKENCHIFKNKVSVFSHRPGIGVVAILAVCRRFENRRIHYTGFRFVSPQEHLFLHCFGIFFISSFLFYFLSENNLKIVSTWLPEKWQRLILCSGNTSLTLNCLRI